MTKRERDAEAKRRAEANIAAKAQDTVDAWSKELVARCKTMKVPDRFLPQFKVVGRTTRPVRRRRSGRAS